MEDLKIYFVNAGAIIFSLTNIDPGLQTTVLILSIIYTSIGIYKRLKK
jgi:hypothetical protein